MARLVSLVVLTALIVFLGITFFHVIAPFLLPLFLAGVLTVLCQPLYRRMIERTRQRPRLAAGLTTAIVLATILIPLLVGTFIASVQLYTFTQRTFDRQQWNDSVAQIRSALEIDSLTRSIDPWLPEEVQSEGLLIELRTNLQRTLGSVAQRSLGLAATSTLGFVGSFVGFLVSLMMFTIGLYYFLADGPALLSSSMRLIPVDNSHQEELLQQFTTVVRAVVFATLLAALAQGVATAGMLAAFGFSHIFVVFVIATLAAMVPLAGTWLVWGPCAVWLAWQGYGWQAFFMTVIGAGVIGTLDNVVRTYVLQSDAKLHPLLAFVSVLGGLQAMGLWGVFIGPIVASFLHALVKIFNFELQQISVENVQRIFRPVSPAVTPPGDASGSSGGSADVVRPDANGESSGASDTEAPQPEASTSPSQPEPDGNP